MINANELRIGDIILYDEDNLYCKVLTIDTLGMTVDFMKNGEIEWLEYENFSPIPLTPKILEKCGFDNYRVGLWGNTYSLGVIKLLKDKEIYILVDIPKCEITSLHQLQNLYFALTNTELIFKP